MTPEEIAEDFNLPVEAVKEAIAYCESDPPEIAKDFEREERLVEASGMTNVPVQTSGNLKGVPAKDVARILKT